MEIDSWEIVPGELDLWQLYSCKIRLRGDRQMGEEPWDIEPWEVESWKLTHKRFASGEVGT
jgi:hypothetical protein